MFEVITVPGPISDGGERFYVGTAQTATEAS